MAIVHRVGPDFGKDLIASTSAGLIAGRGSLLRYAIGPNMRALIRSGRSTREIGNRCVSNCDPLDISHLPDSPTSASTAIAILQNPTPCGLFQPRSLLSQRSTEAEMLPPSRASHRAARAIASTLFFSKSFRGIRSLPHPRATRRHPGRT